MFAKQVQKDVKVGDETVLVRKLSGKSLEKARMARRADQVQNMRDIGADLIKAFRERNEEKATPKPAVEAAAAPAEPTPEELEKARRDSFADYDRDVVLNAGIVRWTAKLDGKPVPVNPETIADLDEEAASLLFDAILDLSVTSVNAKEAQGKG